MVVLAALTGLLAPREIPDIHPALLFPDTEVARKAYIEGRKHSKQKLNDYAHKWSKDLGRVNSATGWSFTTSYAVLLTPMAMCGIAGHEDERNYVAPDHFEKIAEWFETTPLPDQRISFSTVLFAWPGVDWRGGLTYSAKKADVEDVKFVLLVDGDPRKAIFPFKTPEMANSESFGGSVTTTNVNTATVNTDTHSSATVYGSGGYATGYGNSKSTSTVTYNTYDVEGFSAFQASWSLTFPLCDPQGRSLVPKSAKTLVLKVIRRNGELSTTYKLSDFLD